ncbi:MAG: hypothetical protein ACJAT2_003682 [Bacteriovoracaceae bacterium]|jgi:hypothetical protein
MDNEKIEDDMKVEIFYSMDVIKLQTNLNKFFRENPDIEYIDLKYSHVSDSGNGDQTYSALLLYR